MSRRTDPSRTFHYCGSADLGGNNYTPLSRSTPCDASSCPHRNIYDTG